MAKPYVPVQFDVGGGKPLELNQLRGWEFFDKAVAEEFEEQQFQEQLDLASQYRRCFTTDAGRYVLQDMLSRYLQRIVIPEEKNPTADAVRQGQQDVVGFILFLIDFANTGGGRPSVPLDSTE